MFSASVILSRMSRNVFYVREQFLVELQHVFHFHAYDRSLCIDFQSASSSHNPATCSQHHSDIHYTH